MLTSTWLRCMFAEQLFFIVQGEKQSEKKRGDEREKEWTKKRRTGFWDGSKDVLFPWFSDVLLTQTAA